MAGSVVASIGWTSNIRSVTLPTESACGDRGDGRLALVKERIGECGRGGAVRRGEGEVAIGCRTMDVLGGTSLLSYMIMYWFAGSCNGIGLPDGAEDNAS